MKGSQFGRCRTPFNPNLVIINKMKLPIYKGVLLDKNYLLLNKAMQNSKKHEDQRVINLSMW